jgi:integrase
MDPRDISPRDLKNYAVWLTREQKISPKAMLHDVGALSNVMKYFDNNAYEVAKIKFPGAFPNVNFDRLPVLERDIFDKIVSHALTVSDENFRSYAMVCTALGTGTRTLELQNLKVSDVKLSEKTVFIRIVKGIDTYGHSRTVPIRPECLAVIKRWLKLYIRDPDTYLFPNPIGGMLATNTYRNSKQHVEKDLGIKFDYRMCRRTYAQFMLDDGFPIEDVSVIMGHATTRTTEHNYGRKRPERVLASVVQGWYSDE